MRGWVRPPDDSMQPDEGDDEGAEVRAGGQGGCTAPLAARGGCGGRLALSLLHASLGRAHVQEDGIELEDAAGDALAAALGSAHL